MAGEEIAMNEMILTMDSVMWGLEAGWLLLVAAGFVGAGHVAIRTRR
jgi:hypothetical protein